jgi:hypothetical protein
MENGTAALALAKNNTLRKSQMRLRDLYMIHTQASTNNAQLICCSCVIATSA